MSIFQGLLDEIDSDVFHAQEVATKVDEIKPIPDRKEIVPFDQRHNLLHDNVRMAFNKILLVENVVFTEPKSTTITMEGLIDGINFHESELIKHLKPTTRAPIIKCNFERKVLDGYVEPVKVKKSNRGRKKREKKKKNRKKQGMGTEFNTQITFLVLTSPYGAKAERNPDEHPGKGEYKFKVFRTGKIQLPGVNPANVDEVIDCAAVIIDILRNCGAENVCNAKLVNINHVMKNYKFRTKLETNMINLTYLKHVFLAEINLGIEGPPHPAVFDVKYTRKETKLAIKFKTPTERDLDKKCKVNIFPSGKINILGAFADADTLSIYEYLTWVFTEHNIIGRISSPMDNIIAAPLTDEQILLCQRYYYGDLILCKDTIDAIFWKK